MSTRTRLAESVQQSRRAYREGYDAESAAIYKNACPYDFGWLRTAWTSGWLASQRARIPASEREEA